MKATGKSKKERDERRSELTEEQERASSGRGFLLGRSEQTRGWRELGDERDRRVEFQTRDGSFVPERVQEKWF
ncbi:hypothetical protein NL676_007236 [Syzygium grande]|nr:hypothetical protein NL676_007236 [Syzygium grande]